MNVNKSVNANDANYQISRMFLKNIRAIHPFAKFALKTHRTVIANLIFAIFCTSCSSGNSVYATHILVSSPAFTPIPVEVRLQGKFSLYVSYLTHDMTLSCFDLDNGINLDISDDQVDICLLAGPRSNSPWWLEIMYGAKKYHLEDTEPTFQACKSNLSAFSNTNIPNFPENHHVCILTNSNRLSIISFIDMKESPVPDGTVNWNYVTWENSVQP